MDEDDPDPVRDSFTNGELGVLAHLYRGEIYRSTIWRTRLDNTTNWAVVTLGVALSISFATPQASPLPLVLVGILLIFFLMMEARRYRYFNVWRARCRWLELHFVAPLLEDGDLRLDRGWQKILAEDYRRPVYHVSMWVAMGRRVRRNYVWILLIQTIAYTGKLIVHPVPMTRVGDFLERAAIGPIPGWVVLFLGAVYLAATAGIAWWSWHRDRSHGGKRAPASGMG